MSVQEWPLVSVLIVSYRAKDLLERCIHAVFNTDYPQLEVIVVDNGSKDGTVEYIRDQFCADYPVCLIENQENVGPSLARNLGLQVARGTYVAFLDNDTEPDPHWLKTVIDVMESDHSIGACQCKLLLMSDHRVIDYAGDYLSQFGFAVQLVDHGAIDDGQVNEVVEILSAKSAAMVVRADVCHEIGGFDPDYFMYAEDMDLCWRIWLQGYQVVLVPDSKVYHAYGTTERRFPSQQKRVYLYHSCKNYILTLLKNLELPQLARILPLHVLLWGGVATATGLKGDLVGSLLVIRGIFWNVVHLREIMTKRQQVQRMRRISDAMLMSHVMRQKPLGYFVGKFLHPFRLQQARRIK